MGVVSALLQEADEIFRTACEAGAENCDWGIAIGHDGRIQMVQAAGWATESLRLHFGARMAYRVNRSKGRVEVEGRSGLESCTLRSELPNRLLAAGLDFPQYVLA